MKVAIGCDHNGYQLKEDITEYLRECNIECTDFGVSYSDVLVDYPDVAQQIAEAIVAGEFDRGILICGLGIGMCIAANKVPGIRAALCHDVFSAKKSRTSNNAQVLTMGAEIIGKRKAKKVINAWLDSEFAGGDSAGKIEKIQRIEEKYCNRVKYSQILAS